MGVTVFCVSFLLVLAIIFLVKYVKENENTFAPALCNRIDQGTRGLVIAAKNYRSLADMNRIIRNDKIQKEYL